MWRESFEHLCLDRLRALFKETLNDRIADIVAREIHDHRELLTRDVIDFFLAQLMRLECLAQFTVLCMVHTSTGTTAICRHWYIYCVRMLHG